LTIVAVVSGCNDRGDPWGRVPDPMLAPVDGAAPTVGELLGRGYVVVGMREAAYPCGPDCTGDGFSALYLGKDLGPDRPSLAEYACPGMDRHRDTWKCRVLPTPFVPNGGFAPDGR